MSIHCHYFHNGYNDYMKKGLTLIELVIVIAILAILLIITMMSWRNQIDKARDAQRKDDLQRISIAFEEYFSDFGCYPPATILNNCGGGELMPYLDKIPCDPVTKEPYDYVPDSDHPACFRNFRILAHLDNESDPVIGSLNCQPDCGYGPTLNYGVASTNITVANPTKPWPSPSASPLASPEPSGGGGSPSPSPSGNLACDPTGQCNVYANPQAAGCPVSFTDPVVCQLACDESSSYWCNQ